MEQTLCVAKVLFALYQEHTGKLMDEMKMHKLMYFSQRESLMRSGDPLFAGEFLGWNYGPVLPEVRREYQTEHYFDDVEGEVSADTRELLCSVMARYGTMSSWDLSCLSHEEFSWKMSRTGLAVGEKGTQPLSLEAMRMDALRERVRRRNQSSGQGEAADAD